MSEENVELVRSMYRRGDPSRFFDLLDDEVEVDTSALEQLLDDHLSGLVCGKDAVVDYFRHYWGIWDDYVLDPVEIVDAGEDRVLVLHNERGRGRGSGTPFERYWASLYTLRGGKLVRWTNFASREDALEAAGLSE
jgi:ketosteroid isomerase-like protein